MNTNTENTNPGTDKPAGEGPTSSLTDLLKQHKVSLSTVKANKVLLELGILTEAERKSSVSDKTKKYKVLTEVGLRFGINRESRHSDQTSPYYFDNSFEELAQLLLKSTEQQ